MSTTLQDNMNDCVARNLRAWFDFFVFDAGTSTFKHKPDADSFSIGKIYMIKSYITNVGNEIKFKNVENRITNPDPDILSYFSDPACNLPITQMNHIDPKTLNRLDKTTIFDGPYFKVKRRTVLQQKMAGYGVYAEIVPTGHTWKEWWWTSDF
jgi:hypothetical protein